MSISRAVTQTESGKAWEYGLAREFADRLNRHVSLVCNSSRHRSQESYDLLSSNQRLRIDQAANQAALFLWAHDDRLQHATEIILQSDMQGRYGDVRDILIETPDETIGISAKHRHTALKHPRLSGTIDFGKDWYGVPCSRAYWQSVTPIFKDLDGRKRQRWSDLEGKRSRYYLPILQAFIREVNEFAVPECLMRYLLGRFDFYKVIKENGSIVIESFNLEGSLKWGKSIPTPQQIVQFDLKAGSNTTAILHTDQGWQISFRIHNASGMIEPSLKFDVKLVGSPQALARHELVYGHSLPDSVR